jgi:hypothetical protein
MTLDNILDSHLHYRNPETYREVDEEGLPFGGGVNVAVAAVGVG